MRTKVNRRLGPSHQLEQADYDAICLDVDQDPISDRPATSGDDEKKRDDGHFEQVVEEAFKVSPVPNNVSFVHHPTLPTVPVLLSLSYSPYPITFSYPSFSTILFLPSLSYPPYPTLHILLSLAYPYPPTLTLPLLLSPSAVSITARDYGDILTKL